MTKHTDLMERTRRTFDIRLHFAAKLVDFRKGLPGGGNVLGGRQEQFQSVARLFDLCIDQVAQLGVYLGLRGPNAKNTHAPPTHIQNGGGHGIYPPGR